MPDLPGIALAALAAAQGRRGAALLADVYQRPSRAWIHRVAHSVLTPLALAAGRRPAPGRRALAAGWAGHLAIDYLTHHSDSWPPLYPLTRKSLPSPVSYWESRHHGRAFSVAECLALAGAVLTERRDRGRVAALLALAAAALPLALGGLWSSHRGASRGATGPRDRRCRG